MATNNFKPFATGSSANVTTQADYEALAALLTGFQSGKASSAQINKALRQSSTMAAVLGQLIAQAGLDALDNGNVTTLLNNLISALSTNLSLGSASKRNVGTGANQIPDASSFVYGVNGNGAYRTMPGTFQLCRNLVTVPSNSTYTWTFPLAFTSTPGVYYSSLNPSSSAASAMWFNGVGTTSCSIFNPNSISISANILAIY